MASEAETPTVCTPVVFVGRLNEADAVHIQKYRDLLVMDSFTRWTLAVICTLLASGFAYRILEWGRFEWWSWLIAAWVVLVWSSWAINPAPLRVEYTATIPGAGSGIP